MPSSKGVTGCGQSSLAHVRGPEAVQISLKLGGKSFLPLGPKEGSERALLRWVLGVWASPSTFCGTLPSGMGWPPYTFMPLQMASSPPGLPGHLQLFWPALSSPFTLLSLEGSRLLCLFFRLRPAGPAGSSTWHCSSPDLLPFIAVARMLSQAPSLLPWLGAPALSSFCLCFYCPLRPLPSLFSKVCQTALSFLLSAPSDLSLPLSCQIQDLSQLLLAYHVENHIHTILIISLRSSYIGTIIFFHMYM